MPKKRFSHDVAHIRIVINQHIMLPVMKLTLFLCAIIAYPDNNTLVIQKKPLTLYSSSSFYDTITEIKYYGKTSFCAFFEKMSAKKC